MSTMPGWTASRTDCSVLLLTAGFPPWAGLPPLNGLLLGALPLKGLLG